LIDEVEMKLTQKDKMIDKLKERVNYLEEELMNYRTKYVNLLSDSFKIPLTLADADAVEVPDIVEEKLKCELFEMIANETSPDSPLRTIAEYPVVDRYGEKHHWDDSDIHQYLCRELYLHFTKMEQDNLMDMWQSYLGTLKKINGYIFELPNSNNKKKELKGILRKGVPLQLRSQVWSSLVHYHTGKERETMDSIASGAKGKSYYESLLDSKSVYHKHIDADTPRTFPFNIHFAFKGIGCDRVKRVLTAYSNHRGLYSSGMNMVAGIGLLFLDEETTFWFMVAILEKLYPKDYDDKGSKLGIVVDQIIMRDLLCEKMTALQAHFDALDVDPTLATCTWFMVMFIDSLPMESVLRIIDCLLWEGRKVLFRFALAIFRLCESRMIKADDPVTIFILIKEIPKRSYNVERIFKLAFDEEEKSFWRANSINIEEKYSYYMKPLKAEEELKRRKMKKAINIVPLNNVTQLELCRDESFKQIQWKCGTVINEGTINI
jgi:hypothetical protein